MPQAKRQQRTWGRSRCPEILGAKCDRLAMQASGDFQLLPGDDAHREKFACKPTEEEGTWPWKGERGTKMAALAQR